MSDRKVLLIDDDDALLPMLKTAFSRYKFDVLTTSDGADGLEIARAKKPDLILLSVELPVGNGFLVCKEFKLDGDLKEIPIIITSRKASDADFDKHRKLKVRANDYLHKPFSDEELFQKVGNVVGFTLSPDEYTELEAKVHDFLEERGQLESEIREKADRIAALESEVEELRHSSGAGAEELQEKLAALEQEAAQRESDLRSELAQLKKQAERLSRQIATLIEAKEVAEKEAADTKGQLDQLESDLGLPIDELAENIKTWREAAESVGELEAAGERHTKEVISVKAEHAQLKSDHAQVKSELSKIKAELQGLTGEANDLRIAAERDARKRQKLKEALEKAISALE